MSKTTAFSYQTKFPRILRVLEVSGILGKEVDVSVINSVNDRVIRSRNFDCVDDAAPHYREEYADYRSAEEYEIMLDCINVLELLLGEIPHMRGFKNGEITYTAISLTTDFERLNRSLLFNVDFDGTASLRLRKIDTGEVVTEDFDKDASRVLELHGALFGINSTAERIKDAIAEE